MGRSLEVPRVVIACRCCGAPLTAPLAPLLDKTKLSSADGEPYVPAGLFTVGDSERFPAGHFVTNLADVVNTEPHPDHRRRNGCCGPDGMDGINTLCPEGHEVGTECSDCWMSCAIHFDPGLVVVRNDGGPVTIDPFWLAWDGGTVLRLAKVIGEESAFDRLPILADALEEAGCTERTLLDHLRGAVPHARKCWAVDLLTGKS